MESIEFDPDKDHLNCGNHGLSLAEAEYFEWDTAFVEEDERGYDEQRFIATGFLGEWVHVLIYCLRGNRVRPISLRKATRQEVQAYAKRQN
jgi:uncharacterized DUF497 family protein